MRRAVLTTRIVASVGFLGGCASLLAISIRAATTSDAELARSACELMTMFAAIFGIPLRLAALATGLSVSKPRRRARR
jgi:hypothetical protein